MIKFPVLVVLLSLVAGTVAAQSRVYGGGTVAIDSGSRGAFDTLGTSFPAAGGFIGFRFHDAWSMEVHGDRAFAESPERREVIDIFEQSTVRDRAGNGFAVLGVWKTRRQSRVGLAVTMGIAMRVFRTERLSITNIDPNGSFPVSRGTKRTDAGAGLAGGVLVPIVLGRGWSLAPEVRVSLGGTGESGGYFQFYSGVRAMYGF